MSVNRLIQPDMTTPKSSSQSPGIFPPPLKKGDTIALVSPSARLNHTLPARLSRGVSALHSLGYRVIIIFDSTSPTSHQDLVAKRVEELHSAFRDPEVSAIMCTVGGAHSAELLPHLDYELIRRNPKIFIGYSDITSLHAGIFTQAGLRTFYGPDAISTFGEFPKPFDFDIRNFLRVLQDSRDDVIVGPVPRSEMWTDECLEWVDGTDATRARNLKPNRGWKWLRGGNSTGRIFGGVISGLTRLAGTPYWPDFRGRILLLETPLGQCKREQPYSLSDVRIWLTALLLTGVFNEISGFIFGRPHAYSEEQSEQFNQIIMDKLSGMDFPVLVNVDVGHTSPLLTMPLNALVSMDSEKDEFAILEPAVKS